MDIKELQDYWRKKYPLIDTMLWEDKERGIYFGKLRSFGSSTDLREDSIGKLISAGEIFLRNKTT